MLNGVTSDKAAMADKSKGEKLKVLTCPMCLDVVKDATILGCGHSFCKGCLEEYDKRETDHIVCPVCRTCTKLDQRRIAGLTPNYLAKDLEDILTVDLQCPVDDRPSKFCQQHNHVYKDIFCQACHEFICLTCYIDSHQGHKIKKKEELERELKNRRYTLVQEGKIKQTHVEQCLSDAEQQKQDMHCHLNSIEREVRLIYAKKFTALKENEERLLREVANLRNNLDQKLKCCISHCTEVIGRISKSVKLLECHSTKAIDTDMIEENHQECAYLEASLKENIDNESKTHVQEIVDGVEFRPAEQNLLDLGCIVSGIVTGSNSEQATNDVGACETAEAWPTTRSSTEAGNSTKAVKTSRRRRSRRNRGGRYSQAIPTVVENTSPTIVRSRGFPLKDGRLFGLAAFSQDSVVLGYAKDRMGCDRFSLSGDTSPYLGSRVGDVYDVAFLSSGRAVISKQGDEIFVYETCDALRGCPEKRFTCNQSGAFVRVCTDQRDNIYAVNFRSEICIFSLTSNNPKPVRVIPTGDINPKQICVTKKGIMVTSTGDVPPSTVTVFDREGRAGSSIVGNPDTASLENISSVYVAHAEYLYAAVDSRDRVLVARIMNHSSVLSLTRYTLEGTRLVEQVRFQDVQLSYPIQASMFLGSLFYMVSLSPYLVAVATRHHLYFIKLPV